MNTTSLSVIGISTQTGKIKGRNQNLIMAAAVALPLLFLGCILNTGQSGPGFMIKLTVNRLSLKDVEAVERILLSHDYELIRREGNTSTDSVRFSRTLDEAKKLTEPMITVGILCTKSSTPELYENAGIAIFNLRHAENKEIRDGITHIANLILEELEKIKGKGNVLIEEMKVGPPLI